MARIIDVGAVMIYASDPGALADWYAKTLGFDMRDGGGCHYAEIRQSGNRTAFQFGIFAAEG